MTALRWLGRVLLWVLEHFPFLACLTVGIVAGAKERPELAIGFFILGSLSEIAGAVSDVQRRLRRLEDKGGAP